MNKFDPRRQEILHYISEPSDSSSLTNNIIEAIYEDQSGTIWVTTYGGGLNKFDRTKGQFVHIKHDPNNTNSLSSDYSGPILEDRSGNLWIGTISGLNKYDRKQGIFIHYKNDPENASSIGSSFITVIHEDQKETLWIGTMGGGLNKLLRENNSFVRYKNDPLNLESISDNNINCLLEDKEKHGILWIGTRNGLNKFDTASETFDHFQEKDGLANNFVAGILQDNQGNLWLSTENGLSKFDPVSETFTNYDVNDGLQSNEFTGACLNARKGQLFFGGINGINYFYPENIGMNTYVPPIVFTDCRISGLPVKIGGDSPLKKHISETEKIAFSHKHDHFTLEFAALDFHRPQKNQYAYMLEGHDSDWIFLGTTRHVNVSELKPGHYTLHVKGTNNDGIWNEKGISININILHPLWKRTWFQIVLGIIISIIIATSLLTGKKHQPPQVVKQWDINHICSENHISKREREIIVLVIRRKTNEEIADELFISTNTVKCHLYNIFHKMAFLIFKTQRTRRT